MTAPTLTAPAETVTHYQMYIDGAWTDGQAPGRLDVENPANELVFATVPAGSANDATAALEAARRAQPAWAALPPIVRAGYVFDLAAAVRREKSHLARIVVREQGKPLNQAEGEIDAVVTFLTYAAENARRIEGDLLPSDHPNEDVWIRRVPFGVVVGLTAWNYPAALAARKIGPALVAGNTIVVKGHESTPLSAIEIARLAHEVGLPKGVLNVVTGDGRTVGEALVRSPLSDLISMTGSVRAGREIYAAGAQDLKVIRLELGGKAPFIVLEDADLDAAVEAAIVSRFTNCGQICTCNERMYLHKAVAEPFLDKFVSRVKSLRLADPMTNPDMGPKVNRPEVDKVEEIVNEAIGAGAEVLAGGRRLTEGEFARGHWFEPTVLRVDSNRASVMQREIFGPVAPVMTVDSFEQALSFANDTSYGLSAYVYTNDLRRVMRLSRELSFGELYVNRPCGELVQGFHTGWKHSGLGGEDGKYGFDGYLRKQTTYVRW
ncbi:aldehyde dehydrogenase [Microvirga lotononidis]|uniref:NAD-dependent aldehyde dehydrogenase n=1 Tax=Microvirga lotononidis TaxID=864069 RepID=I4YNZ4_9HYPH|nr:aldehyde dehydrogenase [Microvirga lotononidis]EIM25686.1 NAD-dependent aldehyde dehydrogenase [Microvirga lotononidis]WQO25625.1 aldehyde dehydrogenase [Microvirga lotononidis]